MLEIPILIPFFTHDFDEFTLTQNINVAFKS